MVESLPDEILLEIFMRVEPTGSHGRRDAKRLLPLLWTCQRWRRVACDPSLWRDCVVDLATGGVLVELGMGVEQGRPPLLRLHVTRSSLERWDRMFDDARGRLKALAAHCKAAQLDDVALNDVLVNPQPDAKLPWESLTCTDWEGPPRDNPEPFPVEYLSFMPNLTALHLVNVRYTGWFVEVLQHAPRLQVLRFNPSREIHDMYLKLSEGWDVRHTHACLRELRIGANVNLEIIPPGFFSALVFPNLESLIFDRHHAAGDHMLFYGDVPPRLHTLIGVQGQLTLEYAYPNLRVLGHGWMSAGYARSVLTQVDLLQAPRLREYSIPCPKVWGPEFDAYREEVGVLPRHLTVRFAANYAMNSGTAMPPSPHASSAYAAYATPGPEDGDEIVHPLELFENYEGSDVQYQLVIRTDRSAPAGMYDYELVRPGEGKPLVE